MPRIRTIKPAFFHNERIAEIPFAHRLLFVGLWTLADREGRLEDRPRRIKVELFPYDDLDVDAMLDELAAGDDPLIIRYETSAARYIAVRKFSRNQRPHYSEPSSTYPAPPQSLTATAESSAATAEYSARKGKEWNGMEGKGIKEKAETRQLCTRETLKDFDQQLRDVVARKAMP